MLSFKKIVSILRNIANFQIDNYFHVRMIMRLTNILPISVIKDYENLDLTCFTNNICLIVFLVSS